VTLGWARPRARPPWAVAGWFGWPLVDGGDGDAVTVWRWKHGEKGCATRADLGNRTRGDTCLGGGRWLTGSYDELTFEAMQIEASCLLSNQGLV